jgi:ABC-type Fe3+ transport system permease subunit
MKDPKNRLFVKWALILAIICCLGVIVDLYGPFLSWITWVPIHVSDNNFAILVQSSARHAVIYAAITGGLLGLFAALLVWVIASGKKDVKGSVLEK